MAQMIEVLLPDIGDFHDVEVIEILVQPGDRVEVEDPLIMLESDKASMEIPAPQAGVIGEVRVALGDKINQGDLLATLQIAEAAVADVPAQAEAVEPVEDGAGAVAVAQPEPEAAPAPAQAATGTPVVRDVPLPDIGDFKDVEIIELLVSVGDTVETEQSLLTLESDKASMEIPAPFGGVVKSLNVAVGNTINKGDVIAQIETAAPTAAPIEVPPAAANEVAAAAMAPAAEAPRPPGEKEPLRRPVIARPSDAPRGKAHASPGVRRFARELGVDLYLVPGSGPKSRITKEDVQAFRQTCARRGCAGGPPRQAVAACNCRACRRSISPASVRSKSRNSAGSRNSVVRTCIAPG